MMFVHKGVWSHSLAGELLIQLVVAAALVLNFLALVVVVDSQLLQCLQHLFHLLLGSVAVPLQPRQLVLLAHVVTATLQQQL